MLKPPVWKWEIPPYFFFGGLSAGSFLLARLAERCGGDAFRDVTRAGTAIAAVAILPCPPLLIKDLGDPKRFHHMLRVFKPKTPMNLGSWTLTAFGGVLKMAALREWVRSGRERPLPAGVARVLRTGDAPLAALIDIPGIPLALLMAGYTGVLLTTTSIPVWSKNPWLGPLFTASALHTGASAIGLALEAAEGSETPVKKSLTNVNTAGRVVEAATLGAYLSRAGRFAEPLTRGPLRRQLWAGAVAAGLALPEILERIPAKGQAKRRLKITASLLGLAGGFALRHAVTYAGHHSAKDPKAAREATRPKRQ